MKNSQHRNEEKRRTFDCIKGGFLHVCITLLSLNGTAQESLTAQEYLNTELNYCESFNLIVEGLYPATISLGYGGDETTILDDRLREKGFELVDYGWGNWQQGPRMVHRTLKKESCECTVYKYYYTVESCDVDGIYYVITEELHCNKN